MKILKRIIISILSIILILLISALFVNQDYIVERQISINKPSQEVFDYVKFLKNQDNFSKWAMLDPEMKKTYSGTDGTVGFISAWDSQNEDLGAGSQEIMKINDGERIDFELRFLRPFESTEAAYITTEPVNEGQTKVTWGFNGKMIYPTNLMLLFIDFDEMLGPDLQQGLERLKLILEK